MTRHIPPPTAVRPSAAAAPPPAGPGPIRRCGRCGRPASRLYLRGERPICWRCDAESAGGQMRLETKG